MESEYDVSSFVLGVILREEWFGVWTHGVSRWTRVSALALSAASRLGGVSGDISPDCRVTRTTTHKDTKSIGRGPTWLSPRRGPQLERSHGDEIVSVAAHDCSAVI